MASLTKHRCGWIKAGKGPKTTTTQNQTSNSASTNTYGYTTPPDTADTEALRNFNFEHDPRIPYAFARGRQNLANTYQNPLGGFTTPQLRDSTLRAGYEDSAQQEAQALREEDYGLQGLKYAKASDLATRTAPRLVQTGGTNTGTSSGTGTSVTQQPFSIDPFVQGGASIGSALLL